VLGCVCVCVLRCVVLLVLSVTWEMEGTEKKKNGTDAGLIALIDLWPIYHALRCAMLCKLPGCEQPQHQETDLLLLSASQFHAWLRLSRGLVHPLAAFGCICSMHNLCRLRGECNSGLYRRC